MTMYSMFGRHLLPLAAIATVAVVSGCGAASSPEAAPRLAAGLDTEPSPASVEMAPSLESEATAAEGIGVFAIIVADDASIQPVMDFLGAATEAEQSKLEERGVAACMAERGWEYVANLDLVGPTDPGTYAEEAAYRAEWGWGRTPTFDVELPEHSDAVAENVAYFEALPKADQERYQRDLDGQFEESDKVADGSCRDLARNEVGAPVHNPDVMNIISPGFVAIFEHPDYVATLDEYEACMAQLGYHTSDPSMTLNLTWSISFGDESAEALAEAREHEVAMATADWACQGATTLPVQLQLEHELVAEVIAQFPEYAQP